MERRSTAAAPPRVEGPLRVAEPAAATLARGQTRPEENMAGEWPKMAGREVRGRWGLEEQEEGVEGKRWGAGL